MGERRNHREREQLARRVAGEFTDTPCLRLTRPQAHRLFGLRPDICERVLAALVQQRVLVHDADERYHLNDARQWPATRMEQQCVP